MPGQFQVSAKGVLVREHEALLLEGETDSGERRWDLPGGRIEQGEHPHEALLREVSEEVPSILNPTVEDLLLAELSWHLDDKCELIVMYYRLSGDTSKVELTHEHVGYQWIDSRFLQDESLIGRQKFFDKGMKTALGLALA